MGALEKRIIHRCLDLQSNILMIYVQGGDLSARKSIFPNYQFWLSYYLLKNVPN